MTDKEIYPSFDQLYNAEREETTFRRDFTVAWNVSGIEGVKDTFERAFNEWKDNCKYLVELCVVCNHLCWDLYELAKTNASYKEASKFFEECYWKCKDYAFPPEGESPFTEEEQSFFYNILD